MIHIHAWEYITIVGVEFIVGYVVGFVAGRNA